MYDDEEVALMPREGSFNEVELGEFGGETLTEEGTQPIDDRAGVCSRLDYCWQQAVERCGCETSLNSMALLRIGYLFIIAAIVALALSPDTLGFFLFALFSTMAVTLCMRAYVMAARRRRYTTLTERDVMRLHASGLLRMNRVNPTHLRLAMMEGDFSPNDYDNLLRLDEELRESQFNGIPQSQIQRLPTQIVTETSANGMEQCTICLDVPVAGEEVRTLTCMHKFHSACVDKWLCSNNSCPVCKLQVLDL